MSTLLEQASLVMIPSGYKENVVYSQIPTSGAGDLSFTRASNGTRINSAGLVEVCPWNFCNFSEDFTQWASSNATTVTANSTTAPNGTTTADTITPTAVNDDHYRGIVLSPQVGALTSFIYVKPNGNNFFDWGIWNGSQYIVRATFDLVNLTYTFTNAGTATIESVGNGWLKCGISGTNASLSNIDLYFRTRPTGGTGAFTGNGTSGAFVWGAQLNIGTTAKPYFPTTDRLNVPRLTYQNGGGGCPSLLLEKQSTNLALQSQSFTSPWQIGNASGTNPIITANYGISPDGTQNATRIQLARTNTNNSYSQIYQYPISVTSGQQYTWSVYLKSLSGTPTISIIGDFGRPPVTLTSEWVRYTGTGTATASLTQAEIAILGSDYATGNSLSADFLAWGYQLEASSYPTSYIPTTSSSATRVADACFKTGISSLIGQSQGTMFVDSVLTHSTTSNEYLIQVSASSNNRFFIYREGSSNKLGCFAFIGSTIYTQLTSGAITGRVKAAFAYQSGSFAFYVNGTQVGTSTATFSTPPTMGRLDIDSNGGAENGYYNYNEAVLFPTRLTNAELASLTTL